MPRVGFEPTISAGERPKTYALDRAATGTGNDVISHLIIWLVLGKTTRQFYLTCTFRDVSISYWMLAELECK